MIINNATPPAWTAQGVHEDLITCIKKYASKGSSVLDLVVGALSLKLANAGYAVSAADWMIESYMPENINIKKIDLDSKESILESYPSNSFDFLVACEVIEHLGSYSRVKLLQYNIKGFILLLFANVLSPLMVTGNKKGNVVLFVGAKNSSSRTERQRSLGTGDAYILKC